MKVEATIEIASATTARDDLNFISSPFLFAKSELLIRSGGVRSLLVPDVGCLGPVG